MSYPYDPYVQYLSNPATFGFERYPDGVTWFVPYALGVRAPYVKPKEGSSEQFYNEGYGQGAYESSIRVGLAGLVAGAALTLLVLGIARRRAGA